MAEFMKKLNLYLPIYKQTHFVIFETTSVSEYTSNNFKQFHHLFYTISYIGPSPIQLLGTNAAAIQT